MSIGLTDILVALGNFPLLEDISLKGGFRAVANVAARDAIDSSQHKDGMHVWCEAEQELYRLSGVSWVLVPLGGAGSGTSNTVPVWSASGSTLVDSSSSNGAVTLSSGAGQTITIQPLAATSGSGSSVTIYGGQGSATGSGGSALLLGGFGGSTSGDGGAAYVQGGDASTEGHGGSVTIGGGWAAGTDKNGGTINIEAGHSTGNGSAGNIRLQASDTANPSLSGGLVTLIPGGGSSTTTDGVVKIARAGSARAARLQFEADDVTTVSVKAPTTVTSYELVLPNAQGAASTVLTNDGSGNLSWAAGGGGVTNNFVLDANAPPSGNVYNNLASLLAAATSGLINIQLQSNFIISSGTYDLSRCSIYGNGSLTAAQTYDILFSGTATITHLPLKLYNVNLHHAKTSGYLLSCTTREQTILAGFSSLVVDAPATNAFTNLNGQQIDIILENPWAFVQGYNAPFADSQGVGGSGTVNLYGGAVEGTSGKIIDSSSPPSYLNWDDALTSYGGYDNNTTIEFDNLGPATQVTIRDRPESTLTVTSIAGTLNNYQPGNQTKWNSASIVFFDSVTAGATVTGIDGSPNIRTKFLINRGSNTITFKHLNSGGTSTSTNWIITPTAGDFSLTAGSVAWMRYDSASTAWRIYSLGGSSGGGVTGPNPSINTALASWNSVDGTVLSDSSILLDTGTAGISKLIGDAGTRPTIYVQGGASPGTGAGGSVSLVGGAGGSSSGVGGSITLQGGAAGNAINGAGGITIQSGVGFGNSSSASINISTAQGGSTGSSGSIGISTGSAGSSGNGSSGSITLSVGTANGSGTGGGISLIAGTGGATGSGGTTTIRAGAGGATSGNGGATSIFGGNSTTNGSGGQLNLTGGAAAGGNNVGGNVYLNTSNGTSSTTLSVGSGAGPAVAIFGGGGGATGAGGTVVLKGGTGGATSGNGGAVTVWGGEPATSGVGGALNLYGGAGANSNAGGAITLLGGGGHLTGAGGIVTLQGGSGGTSAVGAAINLKGGNGGTGGGAVNVIGGTPTAGPGGAVNIQGSAGVGTNNVGGNVYINTTNGTSALTLSAGSGTGPKVAIFGGGGGATGEGGTALLQGGSGGSTSGNGGTVSVVGGSATSGSGGAVSLTAGTGAGTTAGANATVEASAGIGTNQNGGNVILTPGVATGNGTPGVVNVSPASGNAVVKAGTGDLYVGGIPGSTAAVGANVIRRVPSVISTTGQTLIAGSFQKIDSSGTLSGGILNLPNPTTCAGQVTRFVETAASPNTFTVKCATACNINGVASSTGVSAGGGGTANWRMWEAWSDGTDWFISHNDGNTL